VTYIQEKKEIPILPEKVVQKFLNPLELQIYKLLLQAEERKEGSNERNDRKNVMKNDR
jgi:hypothetical protein